MNTEQIELVQASFAQVRPIADQAAETFYQRLFEAEALLWTLEYYLGEEFTPQLTDAWVAAYTTLAGAMIAAAEAEMVLNPEVSFLQERLFG